MKIIVDVADCRVSDDPMSIIATYSLGSCIAVCASDPAAGVGGLLHFMLPDSRISPEKANLKPFMFADTGIPFLFREMVRLGAVQKRIVVKAVGGAEGFDSTGIFNIGKRNIVAVRKLLWQYGIIAGPSELGGTGYRTVFLTIATGSVLVKTAGYGEHVL